MTTAWVARLVACVLALLLGNSTPASASPAVTTTNSAPAYVYDVATVASVDVRTGGGVDSGSAQFTGLRERDVAPAGSIQGTSTTPAVLGNATEAGTDLVRYDPEWASRQLLDQNTPGSSGYGVTPGGRTVSAHAAERISVGGPGRPPTSLSTVDEILDTGTSVRYDPIRDSIQVRAPQMPGRPYVVVDSSGTHIVTVMVPK